MQLLLFQGEIKWNRQRIRFRLTKHICYKIKVLIPFSCRIKRQPYVSELDFPGPFISQVDSLQTNYTDPLALFARLWSLYLQIEETRVNIDKISEHVEEAKRLYSVILSAPIPEPSECHAGLRHLLGPAGPRVPLRAAAEGVFPHTRVPAGSVPALLTLSCSHCPVNVCLLGCASSLTQHTGSSLCVAACRLFSWGL